MIRILKSYAGVAALGLSFGLLAVQAAQAIDFKTIAPLKGLCRADIMDPCTPYNLFGPPVISGDFVVWTNRAGPADGIWSYQISNKKIRKLVGFETKVPGGAGKFTSFGNPGSDFPTTIGGETAAFFGRDQDNVLGVYAVSVRGGKVSRIADTRMAVPGGDGRLFTDLRFASTNGKVVAFYGLGANNATGIFRAKVDGSALRAVIDSTDTQLDARTPSGPSPDYFGLFTRPNVGKRFVNFYAGGLFDPVSGPNATFRADGGFIDIVDNLTKLQGGTTGAHVRTGVISADEQSDDIAVAADQPSTGYAGIFKAENLDKALAFVTTKSKVPGETVNMYGFFGFGLDPSGLAFTANYLPPDGGSPTAVFFVDKPGGKILTVAKNGPSYYLPYLGDRSISNGVIAFTEGYNGVDTFYLATPKK
jgi:hypothetical protein